MESHAASRVLPFTARQLFDLVVDIEQYPQFIPACRMVEVGPREDLDDGSYAFETLLVFRYRKLGIREDFRSRVTCDLERLTVVSQSDSPPFNAFRAVWSFEDIGERMSEARIEVDYEFRSRVLGVLLGHGTGIGVERLITAWDSRAHEIYGGVAA